MIKAPTRFRRFCARSPRAGPRVYCDEPPVGVTRVRADAGQANRGGRVASRAGGPARVDGVADDIFRTLFFGETARVTRC